MLTVGDTNLDLTRQLNKILHGISRKEARTCCHSKFLKKQKTNGFYFYLTFVLMNIFGFIKGDKIFFQNLLSSTGSFTPLWRSSATEV